ncbi:MAG: branched-chain amino acid ABC transporter substrate-binding protein [Dehalococcoidia bacterium]
MRRRLAPILLVIALTLAACGGSGRGAPAANPSPETTPAPDIVIPAGTPITIGISVALTGDQQSIGQDIADAASLAITERGASVQGHPVSAVRKDDGCTDPEKAVAVARAFIADPAVAGVIGPMCTTGAQAADRLYEAAHMVHISPSATRVELSQQGEQYFFRMAWRDDRQADVQARYARAGLKAARAVVIDDGEPYGKGLADAFARTFESLGGTVISRERITRGTVDFSAIARRTTSAKPDIVVFEGLNPEAALLVKELRTQQYAGTFMAPDGALSVRDYVQAAGAAAEGSIVSGGSQPDEQFIAKFRDAFQRVPASAFVLESYDAASVLLAAVNAVATPGSDGSLRIDRAKLAAALRATKTLGLTGAIAFDARGDRTGDTAAQAGLVLYRVTNGRFVPVAG